MNRNVLAVAGLIVIVALAAIALNFNAPANSVMEKNALVKEQVMVKEDVAMQKDVMVQNESMQKDAMVKDAMQKYGGVVLAGSKTPLLDFSKEDYENALKEGKFVVLYFYANWCPACKAEFPLMQSAFNELNRSDVVGFRVNYNDDQTDDYEKSLASQFGVAYQHTKVILKGETRLSKSPESWTKEDYLVAVAKLN